MTMGNDQTPFALLYRDTLCAAQAYFRPDTRANRIAWLIFGGSMVLVRGYCRACEGVAWLLRGCCRHMWLLRCCCVA